MICPYFGTVDYCLIKMSTTNKSSIYFYANKCLLFLSIGFIYNEKSTKLKRLLTF